MAEILLVKQLVPESTKNMGQALQVSRDDDEVHPNPLTQKINDGEPNEKDVLTAILITDEAKAPSETPTPSPQKENKNRFLKIFSLIMMSLLNCAIVLMMHHLRTRKGDKFIATTAVISTEVFKFILSLFLILINQKSISKWFNYLWENTIKSPKDCAKMSVPGFIYTVYNNLFFIAVSNLDVATLQVLYQFRIFTACILSVLILGKKISWLQALSMVILFGGICLAQLKLDEKEDAKPLNASENPKPLVGVIAVLAATVCSGLGGVYIEKMLKSRDKSLWLRNTQLSFFGIIIGIFAMLTKDHSIIFEKGFFWGYDILVTFTVLIQAVSGMTIAVVFKYADNILKSFAASMSIIFSCVAAVFLFEEHLTIQFFIGTFLVLLSIFMYNS